MASEATCKTCGGTGTVDAGIVWELEDGSEMTPDLLCPECQGGPNLFLKPAIRKLPDHKEADGG